MLDIQSSPLALQKAITTLRQGHGRSEEFLVLKAKVKLFQNKRLEKTYQDLLENKNTQRACRFFLDQLYCVHDLSIRDHQVERVLPKLEKLLPDKAVETLGKVIYMDYLAEAMDDELTQFINDKGLASNKLLEDIDYMDAFRQQNRFDTREQQIVLIREVGESLRKLMRLPFLRPLLKMTRGAAQKSNLEDFHDFLSQGIDAFGALEKPTLFFQIIQEREMTILEGIRQGALSKLT